MSEEDLIEELKKDILRLTKISIGLQQENLQLKERIENAIDFINTYTNVINLEAFDCLKLMYKIEEILNDSK